MRMVAEVAAACCCCCRWRWLPEQQAPAAQRKRVGTAGCRTPYLLSAAAPPQLLTTDASAAGGAAPSPARRTTHVCICGGLTAVTVPAPLTVAAFTAATTAAVGDTMPETRPHHHRVAEVVSAAGTGDTLEQLARCLLPATAHSSGLYGTGMYRARASPSTFAASGPGAHAAGSGPCPGTAGRFPSLWAIAVPRGGGWGRVYEPGGVAAGGTGARRRRFWPLQWQTARGAPAGKDDMLAWVCEAWVQGRGPLMAQSASRAGPVPCRAV